MQGTTEAEGWLYIGGWPGLHVTIEDPTVSRHHARIRRTSVGFLIEDLGSVNGTWVNGVAVPAGTPTAVQPNGRVLLGRHILDLADPRLRQGSGAAAQLGTLVLGASTECDLVFDQPMVSRRHAEVWSDGGIVYVNDGAPLPAGGRRASANGTYVDRVRIWAPTPITAQSHLHLGSLSVPQKVVRSWWSDSPIGPRGASSPAEGTSLTLPSSGDITIGRDPDRCGVVLSDARVSSVHAMIRVSPAGVEVIDLGSENGVFVNGVRVRGSVPLPKDADVLIGPVPLDLREGRVAAGVVGLARGIRLRAEGVSFAVDDPAFDLDSTSAPGDRAKVAVRRALLAWGLRVPRRNLLERMSLALGPGEVIAVMGTSGAGKSTLLRLLSGYKRPETGRVLADGVELRRNFARFAHRIGNVPQDDIMHRDLTVEQVLTYTGRLRMPGETPAQVADRVRSVLDDLQLGHIAGSRVGDPVSGGISGGQRRRVNIAMELMRQPDLLFLDEPTSGLDSHSTEQVLSLIRDLADGGCTVVMTIHQPGESALEKIDHLLLVGKGQGSIARKRGGELLYLGPLKEAVAYFRKAAQSTLGHDVVGGSRNPAEFVLDVVNEHPNVPALAEVYDGSQERTTFFKARPEVGAAQGSGSSHLEKAPRVSWPFQVAALVSRSIQLKVADWPSLAVQLAQPVILLVLMSFLFRNAVQQETVSGVTGWFSSHQSFLQALFMLAAGSLWLGCSNAAREIVSERAIFIRELHWGLSSTAYLASKFIVQAQLCLLQMVILAGVGIAMGYGSWTVYPQLLAVLYMGALCGTGLGLLLSARSSSELMAVAMVPLVLLPQLLLSGFLPIYDRMAGWLQGLSHGVPLRWIFESLLRTQAAALDDEVCRADQLWWSADSAACTASGAETVPLGDAVIRDVMGTVEADGEVSSGGVESILAMIDLGDAAAGVSLAVVALLGVCCLGGSALILSSVKRVERG